MAMPVMQQVCVVAAAGYLASQPAPPCPTVRGHDDLALQHVARLSAVVRPWELAGWAAPGGPRLDAQLLQQQAVD
jgi:hypothetical protein